MPPFAVAPLRVVALSLTWLLTAAPVPASDLAEVRANGRLVMLCFPQEQNPFVHSLVAKRGERGLRQYGGIDVELMRRFAGELGVELEVRPVRPAVSAMIPALLRGDGDVIANALGITQERRRLVDFSVPYISSREGLVARKDAGIEGIEDLAGKTAATIAGSSHEDVLMRLRIADLRVLHVDFSLETYEAVADGRAHFTVQDAESAAETLADFYELDQQLAVVSVLPEKAHYGFAVRPGSDLLPLLDRFVERLATSGELAKILAAAE